MKRDTRALDVFRRIINEAQSNLEELCSFWNVYEKQQFFAGAVTIYDKYFIQQISYNHAHSFNDRIMQYSYPVFVRRFYDSEFCNLPGIAHKALDKEAIALYSKLIYSCGIIGWMQSMIDNTSAGFYSCWKFLNYIRVRFSDKYHWNEYLENEYCLWYSSMVAKIQSEEYESLNKRLPAIVEKLKSGVFVWKDSFLGYTNDYETEMFFNKHALLDAQQSVSWDIFPPDCKFGTMFYGNIVQNIVDFTGYSIKHVYCANLLLQDNPKLLYENLLNVFFVEEDVVRFIQENAESSDAEAKDILRMISLSPNTIKYYSNGNAKAAPLIQISKHQYLRSIQGFLDDPFDFM